MVESLQVTHDLRPPGLALRQIHPSDSTAPQVAHVHETAGFWAVIGPTINDHGSDRPVDRVRSGPLLEALMLKLMILWMVIGLVLALVGGITDSVKK
jgi:hypothetical protein